MAVYYFALIINLIVSIFLSNYSEKGLSTSGNTMSRKSRKQIYLVFTFIQLTCLAGFRGLSVGTDTRAYQQIFEQISQIDSLQGLLGIREEFGYVLLNKLIFLFGGNYRVMFIVTSAITVGCFLKFIYDNTENIYFGTFLFITLMLYFNMFNGVRQYMAIGIGLNAYTMIKNKKYINFFMLVLLSTFFHKTGIIYLGLIAIPIGLKHPKINWLYAVGLIVCFIFMDAISVFVFNILGYGGYLDGYYASAEFGIMMPVVYGAFAMFILFSIKYNKKTFKEHYAELIMLVALLFMTMVTNLHFNAAARAMWCFSPILLTFVPNCLNYYKKNERLVVGGTISLVCVLYFAYCLSINWQRIVPYIFS